MRRSYLKISRLTFFRLAKSNLDLLEPWCYLDLTSDNTAAEALSPISTRILTLQIICVSRNLIWDSAGLLCYGKTSGWRRQRAWAGKPSTARSGVTPCFLFRCRDILLKESLLSGWSLQSWILLFVATSINVFSTSICCPIMDAF